MGEKSAFGRGLFIGLLLSTSFGCSSSIFTGDSSNDFKGGAQLQNSSPDCTGLDLSSEALDVPTFRKLIRCLNGNGSIPAYDALVSKATDAQLAPILTVLNREFALNKPRLAELDRTFQQMEAQGLLKGVFDQLHKHLGDPALGLAFMRMLRSAVLIDGEPDPAVLGLVRVLVEQIEAQGKARENLRKFLDGAIQATELPSYKALVEGFMLSIPAGRPLLRVLAERGFLYAQDKARAERELGGVLLHGAADGSMFTVLDHFYYGKVSPAPRLAQPGAGRNNRPGTSTRIRGGAPVPPSFEPVELPSTKAPDDVRLQISRLESLLRFLMLERKSEVLVPMSRLFGQVNGPIACLDGTKRIANGAMHIMDEMLKHKPVDVPYWLLRKNVLKMKLASDVCQLPSELDALMGVFEKLSDGYPGPVDDGDLLVTMAQLVAALKAGEGRGPEYRKMLVDWMGDQRQVSLQSHLADALGELVRPERALLPNALLLLDSGYRAPVATAAQFLVERRELRSFPGRPSPKSAYEALTSAMLRVDPAEFGQLVVAASRYLDEQAPIAQPLLSTVREALFMNNVNPLLDGFLAVARRADSEPAFFKALLELSALPEFEAALRLTSQMAGGTGLRDLVSGVLTLFRGSTAGQAPEPTLAGSSRPLRVARSSRLAWAPPPVRPRGLEAVWPRDLGRLQACRALDLNTGLGDTASASWAGQLKHLGACVNVEGRYGELEPFLAYATDPARPVHGGRPLARYFIDQVVEFFKVPNPFTRKSMLDEVSDLLVDPAKYRDVVAAQDLSRFLFGEAFCAVKGTACAGRSERLAPAQALMRVAGPLVSDATTLQANLNLAARVIEHEGFPAALRLIRDSFKDAKHQSVVREPLRPEMNSQIMAALRAQLLLHERVAVSDLDEVEKRKVLEYYTQLQSGVERFQYTGPSDFKRTIKPLLDKLSDPRWNLYENVVKFLYRMDRNPYDPQWWSSWFQRLSSKMRVIPYYYPGKYPGKDKPTVRIVSQLDLLELIVIDSDFTLEELGQVGGSLFENPKEVFAIKYLSWLAEAGEDLQPWVERLRADLDKYYGLAFDSSLTKRLITDELRRRLYNLKQIFPLLPEVSTQQELTTYNGRRLVRNDLGVLRDLFRDVLDATPRARQGTFTRQDNSLSFILELVRFGLLRNVGASMWYHDGSEARAVDAAPVIRLLTQGGYVRNAIGYGPNRDMVAVLSHLLVDDYAPRSRPVFGRKYPLLGELIDAVFEWTASDLAARAVVPGSVRKIGILRESAYEMARLLDLADKRARNRGRSTGVIPELVRTLRPLLGSEEGTRFVTNQIDRLRSLLVDQDTARFLRRLVASSGQMFATGRGYAEGPGFNRVLELLTLALDELAVSDAQLMRWNMTYIDALLGTPGNALEVAFDVLSNLKDDRDFGRFRSSVGERIEHQVLRWFVNAGGASHMAPRLQQFTAQKLKNGEALALLRFIANQSSHDRLYRELKFIGDPKYIGGLREATDLLKAGLEDASR